LNCHQAVNPSINHVSRREERGNYLFNNATHTLGPQRKRTREVTPADLKRGGGEGFCCRISALGKK
jgi:hypothetical protein